MFSVKKKRLSYLWCLANIQFFRFHFLHFLKIPSRQFICFW